MLIPYSTSSKLTYEYEYVVDLPDDVPDLLGAVVLDDVLVRAELVLCPTLDAVHVQQVGYKVKENMNIFLLQ